MMKIRIICRTAWAGFAVLFLLVTSLGAVQAADQVELKDISWAHEGPLGKFDRAALQRGLQVYREVCASCHSLNYIAFRNLTEIGFTEDQAKIIAEDYDVEDGPDEYGDMFDRPGQLSDYFPAPFANEQMARMANGGALPPDLSLITKARANGEDYVYSLMTGFVDPPEDFEVTEGMYYNPYFSGEQIAMAPPLFEDFVIYEDGTPATVEQMAKDVVVFLAWAAEPTLEQRKRIGLKTMAYLLILVGLFYFVSRRVHARLKSAGA